MNIEKYDEIELIGRLERLFNKMNKNKDDALKVGLWATGIKKQKSYFVNKFVDIPRDITITLKEKAKFHAEQHFINNVHLKSFLEKRGIVFVTYIPCPECMKYMCDMVNKTGSNKKLRIIYFYDGNNKAKRKSYNEYRKYIDFKPFESKNKKLLKQMDRISNYGKLWDTKKHPKQI